MLDLSHHGGNEGEVVVQDVGAVDQEAEDETGPHDRIAEERLDDRVPSAVVLEHGQRHLGQRERQALVLHPLAPQNHQGAQQHEVVGGEKEEPAQQHGSPQVPGDGVDAVPVVEVAHRLVVAEYEPLRQQRVDDLGPSILRGGVEDHPGDAHHQLLRHPPGGYGGGHGHHGEDDRQLAGPQVPAAFERGKDHLDGQEEHEKEDEGSRGTGAETNARPAHHVQRVGQDEGDGERRERPDQDAAGGDSPPVQVLRRGGGCAPGRVGATGWSGGAPVSGC